MIDELTNISALINWWMPLAAALAIVAVLAVVLLVRRRRERTDAPLRTHRARRPPD